MTPDLIERCAKIGYQCMMDKLTSQGWPTHDLSGRDYTDWENENDACKQDWRDAATAILNEAGIS